jgi:hypothetical protein
MRTTNNISSKVFDNRFSMQISNYFLLFFFTFLVIHTAYSPEQLLKDDSVISIVLGPFGDAKNTGRAIGDCFERGLTLQCAEKIQRDITEKNYPILCVITRTAGDIVPELQTASFTNRLQPDVFIAFNFYFSKKPNPTITLYQYDNGAPLYNYAPDALYALSYDNAYMLQQHITNNCISFLTQQLQQPSFTHFFTFLGHHALPVKQLIGITSASILIEIGINSKQSYDVIMPHITTLIISLANHLEP